MRGPSATARRVTSAELGRGPPKRHPIPTLAARPYGSRVRIPTSSAPPYGSRPRIPTFAALGLLLAPNPDWVGSGSSLPALASWLSVSAGKLGLRAPPPEHPGAGAIPPKHRSRHSPSTPGAGAIPPKHRSRHSRSTREPEPSHRSTEAPQPERPGADAIPPEHRGATAGARGSRGRGARAGPEAAEPPRRSTDQGLSPPCTRSGTFAAGRSRGRQAGARNRSGGRDAAGSDAARAPLQAE